MVDGKTLGLAGFGNGSYTQEDGEVLFESLPSAWIGVISEAVKESSNQLLSNTLPSFIVDRILDNDNTNLRSTDRSSGRKNLIPRALLITIKRAKWL